MRIPRFRPTAVSARFSRISCPMICSTRPCSLPNPSPYPHWCLSSPRWAKARPKPPCIWPKPPPPAFSAPAIILLYRLRRPATRCSAACASFWNAPPKGTRSISSFFTATPPCPPNFSSYANGHQTPCPPGLKRTPATTAPRPPLLLAEWFTFTASSGLSRTPYGVLGRDRSGAAGGCSGRALHFFVRMFGLCNKTVIVDEVHAYDAYMSQAPRPAAQTMAQGFGLSRGFTFLATHSLRVATPPAASLSAWTRCTHRASLPPSPIRASVGQSAEGCGKLARGCCRANACAAGWRFANWNPTKPLASISRTCSPRADFALVDHMQHGRARAGAVHCARALLPRRVRGWCAGAGPLSCALSVLRTGSTGEACPGPLRKARRTD